MDFGVKKGENDRGDDEKKDNERDELSHKGGKSHVHGAQSDWALWESLQNIKWDLFNLPRN